MTNRPSKNIPPPARPVTKRQQAWQDREANIQRRVVLTIGAVIGLALLLIIAGVVWDRVVVPGRAIITVNGQELSRTDYDQIVRSQTIAQMAQSLQFTKLLGPNASFGENQSSFTQQVVEANSRLATLGTIRSQREPTDDTVIAAWVEQDLINKAAQAQFSIAPSNGEIDQQIVASLGSLLEEPAPLTSTTELSPTTGITTTATVSEADATVGPAGEEDVSATASAEEATTVATADAMATSGPTATPAPTASPTASPVPEVATDKVGEIVRVLHDEYTSILADLPEGAIDDIRNPHASEADFTNALRQQYRDNLIRTQVQEKLLPVVNAEDTTTPEQINARHILLKVPRPEPTPEPTPTVAAPDTDATATADETATAAPAEETVTAAPEPTATLSPEELDTLFAERKTEIDTIYADVIADPDKFADFARQYSEDDTNASNGGDLGAFGPGQMVAPFDEVAFALNENEISEPVRTEFGWHIIQRLPEDPEAKLTRQREAAFTTWLDALKSKATVIPAPTATATEIPLPTPEVTEPAPEGTVTTPDATAETTP